MCHQVVEIMDLFQSNKQSRNLFRQRRHKNQNTESLSTGENKGSIEDLAGVLKQLLTKAAKGDDQETEIKKIIDVIPSNNKYEAKSEKSDQTNEKEKVRKKHKNDHDSRDSDSDRSLSPLPPKLPVYSGEPKSTSWQSFIAKFDRIANRKYGQRIRSFIVCLIVCQKRH